MLEMPMSIGSFFTPWWVVEEAEEELREGERWPPPGNYIVDHVDHVQSDDGIDNITIGWEGGRDKKEMASTWSRLQTASSACRCRRRESRRNFNAGSDVGRLFLQRGCNRNIVEKGLKFLWIKILL